MMPRLRGTNTSSAGISSSFSSFASDALRSLIRTSRNTSTEPLIELRTTNPCTPQEHPDDYRKTDQFQAARVRRRHGAGGLPAHRDIERRASSNTHRQG